MLSHRSPLPARKNKQATTVALFFLTTTAVVFVLHSADALKSGPRIVAKTGIVGRFADAAGRSAVQKELHPCARLFRWQRDVLFQVEQIGASRRPEPRQEGFAHLAVDEEGADIARPDAGFIHLNDRGDLCEKGDAVVIALDLANLQRDRLDPRRRDGAFSFSGGGPYAEHGKDRRIKECAAHWESSFTFRSGPQVEMVTQGNIANQKKRSGTAPRALTAPLLRWYDANARVLPWRAPPRSRARPDPYRVWLSEVMLQQTTVATVRPRFEAFLARWPTVEALAAAPLDDVTGEWAGLGYYARARNLHRCAQAVAAHGNFPDTEEGLRALPGVGDYTAAAVAAIAFDRRAVVMDGNIARVAARLFAIDAPLPGAKPALKEAISAVWPKKRSGDFAQGLMDLGATVCTPRAPKCLSCPVAAHCEAHARGIAPSLPAKASKAKKPTRCGIVYALINHKGEVLFERRPEKGLLGGMLGLPGTAWVEAPFPPRQARAREKWRRAGTVRHTFTHFHLELDVMTARALEPATAGADRQWRDPRQTRLPTVMKKAVALAVAQSGDQE